MSWKTHVFLLLVALSLWWGSVLLAAIVQDWQQWQIFRDPHTHKLIPVINPPDNNTSRIQLLRMGPIPCECQSLVCGCCVFMDIEYFDYHRNGCMNMTYYPNDFALGANMLWNGNSVWSQNVSGKNPPPACVQMPIPYLPAMDMCVRMYDIYTPGYNIHMCMNWEFRTERAPLLVLEFDCFRMGQDGWANIKPGTPNAGLPTEMGGGEGGGAAAGAAAPQGEEAPQGAQQALEVEEVISEASEGDDNKRKPTTTTKKPPKKAPPQPATGVPPLNLNVEEIDSSSLTLPSTTANPSSNKVASQEHFEAPNLNLNIKEFEDPDTRLSVLNAPEKVVKIDIKLDTLNNTITEKGKDLQFVKHFSILNPVREIDLNRELENLMEDSTKNKTRNLEMDYKVMHSSANSTSDSAKKVLRHRREAGGKRKRIRTRPPTKKKNKNNNKNSNKNNKRRNKNRNRNKNREQHRNRNKLYAPTLSFNIVEMSQEYGKGNRPITLPSFAEDSRATPSGPMEPRKEIILTYPEPRMHREHRTADVELPPLCPPKPSGGYTVPQNKDLDYEDSSKFPYRHVTKKENLVLPLESRALRTHRERRAAEVNQEVSSAEGVGEQDSAEDIRQRRAAEGVQELLSAEESGERYSVEDTRERRSAEDIQELLSAKEVGEQHLSEDIKQRRSAEDSAEDSAEETEKRDSTEEVRKRRSAEEIRARKPGKKGNRRTTEHPLFVAPPLSLNVLEVEPGYNDRYQLDQTLTAATTPATTPTTTMTSTVTSPMTPKPRPDIDININNLYIYLASFTTYARNDTLDYPEA